jgi:hypothetical protein
MATRIEKDREGCLTSRLGLLALELNTVLDHLHYAVSPLDSQLLRTTQQCGRQNTKQSDRVESMDLEDGMLVESRWLGYKMIHSRPMSQSLYDHVGDSPDEIQFSLKQT